MKKIDLDLMSSTIGGRMSCGAALGFYAVAFIGAAMATGGATLLVGLITMGGSIWTAIDSCAT